MNTVKIGRFLAQLRREKSMTQEQLAQKMGVSNRSVSRWENGNTMPDFSQIHLLCNLLDITVAEFLDGERVPDQPRWKTGVNQLLELARQQQRERNKKLNVCFGCGVLLLLLAVVLSRTPDVASVFPGLYSSYGTGVLMVLGLSLAGKGFYHINQYASFTEKQIAVMTVGEDTIAMTTAEEMLQYTRKYQSGEKRQQVKAFAQLEQNLREGEYATLSFLWDGCSVNGNPEQWHGAAAFTNQRLLLCGETVRGRLFLSYESQWYEVEEIQSIQQRQNKLEVKANGDIVTIRGEKMDAVWEAINKQNMIP